MDFGHLKVSAVTLGFDKENYILKQQRKARATQMMEEAAEDEARRRAREVVEAAARSSAEEAACAATAADRSSADSKNLGRSSCSDECVNAAALAIVSGS